MLLDLYSFVFNPTPPGYLNNLARTRCSHSRRGFDFPNIEPSETDIFTIEFTADLQNDRTPTAVSFQCALLKTDTTATPDTNPSARITGSATLTIGRNPVTGNVRTYANQKFSGFVSGNLYSITGQIMTDDGCTVERFSRVYCTPSN